MIKKRMILIIMKYKIKTSYNTANRWKNKSNIKIMKLVVINKINLIKMINYKTIKINKLS